MDLLNWIVVLVGLPLTLLTAVYAHAMYLYARGDLAQQKGKLDEAAQRFRNAATSRNPIGRGVAYVALARVLLKQGKPAEALVALRQALTRTRTPSVILAAYQLFADLALTLPPPQRAETLAEAERLLTATRMPAPLRAILLTQFAGACMKQARFDDARRLASEALRQDPLQPTALFLAGWLALQAGEIRVAEETFRKITRVNERDQRPLGLYGLGAAAFYAGRLDEAAELFEKTRREGSRLLAPFALARKAITLTLKGEDASHTLNQAEAALREIASLRPEEQSSRWLIRMARAYAESDAAVAEAAMQAAPPSEKIEAEVLAALLLGQKFENAIWKAVPPQPLLERLAARR